MRQIANPIKQNIDKPDILHSEGRMADQFNFLCVCVYLCNTQNIFSALLCMAELFQKPHYPPLLTVDAGIAQESSPLLSLCNSLLCVHKENQEPDGISRYVLVLAHAF